MADKLTEKQEAFARKVAEGSTYSAAYRSAYSVDGMLQKTVNEEASRVASARKVSARITELQEKAQERTLVTIKTISDELDEARALAIEKAQTATAVAASMGKAKLHGLIVSKSEVTRKRDISDLDDNEIDALIASAEEGEVEATGVTSEPSSFH